MALATSAPSPLWALLDESLQNSLELAAFRRQNGVTLHTFRKDLDCSHPACRSARFVLLVTPPLRLLWKNCMPTHS
jgi:hypothetical protein